MKKPQRIGVEVGCGTLAVLGHCLGYRLAQLLGIVPGRLSLLPLVGSVAALNRSESEPWPSSAGGSHLLGGACPLCALPWREGAHLLGGVPSFASAAVSWRLRGRLYLISSTVRAVNSILLLRSVQNPCATRNFLVRYSCLFGFGVRPRKMGGWGAQERTPWHHSEKR